VPSLPAQVQNLINLEAEKADGVALHALRLADFYGEPFNQVFGSSPLWLGFRDDRALVATGPASADAVKKVAGKQPANAPIALVELSVARLAPLADPGRAQAIQAVAQNIFGADPKGDKVTAVIEGGDRLRLRLSVDGKLLKFGVAMQSAEDVKKE
jgi:hypothetical protein